MSNRKARRAWNAAVRKQIRRRRVRYVEIRHDADCPIYSSVGVCTCNPDRVLMDEARTVLALVEGAGPYDPSEVIGGLE